MKPKRIAITGVSGYLGRRLVETLLEREETESLVGIDIRPPGLKDKKLFFYEMDVRDRGISDVFRKHEVDTLFHLAFIVTPVHDIKLMHDVDINGTMNVLDASRNAGSKHVIAITSTLAYGAHRDNPEELTEDSPLRGNASYPYGFNKALTDGFIRDFARQHPEMVVTTLRPCTVFGPRVDNYVSRMLFMPVTPTIMGHDARVQFVHEDDFVQACLLAMEMRKGGAFNITGDGTMRTSEIAGMTGARTLSLPYCMLAPLLELLWRLRAPGVEVNRGYLDYIRFSFVASNARAKRELGFSPRYTSRETLVEAIRGKGGAVQCGNKR